MSNPGLLPSNTLLIRLSPPGQTYYLPQPSLSRPPSPSGGHASDPEVDTSKSRGSTNRTVIPRTPHLRTSFQTEEQEPSDHLTRGRGRHLREPAKTASWNDLLKCVYRVYLIIVLAKCTDNFIVEVGEFTCCDLRDKTESSRSRT